MSNDTVKPRMTPAELREACHYCAGATVVSFVLGCGYDDIMVTDDGPRWPTATSQVELTGWKILDDDCGEPQPCLDTALKVAASVHEAGAMAALKYRGLGWHRISFIGTETVSILDDPKVWAAVEALVARIEDNAEGDGCYGALAMHDDGPAAIKVLTDGGLYPTYWADEGQAAAHARLLDTIAGDDADRRAAVADLFPRIEAAQA